MMRTLNVSLMGAPTHLLLPLVPELATAAGAACHSGLVKPSAVLTAMGIDEERALCSLRLSLGRDNTEAQIDRAVALLAAAAQQLMAVG